MVQQHSKKNWQLRQFTGNFSSEQVRNTALELGLPEIIVKILILRNICDRDAISEFLTPALAQLPRPSLMKDMDRAVDVIMDALQSQEPVTVYGDFDADGVTATSLLYLFFREAGANIGYYIPDRLTEGYGLNSNAVEKIYQANLQQWGRAGVLLTADCGISDTAEIDEAKSLGFRVIVTDHHKPPPVIPEADAVLNPLQEDCSFPCKKLAGVGVAFYLVLGLRSELITRDHWPEEKIPNLKSYMDLAAIGTIADQVPVSECNRIIIRAGLEIINTDCRIGLQELLKNSRNNGGIITPEVVAFQLAPRINAVGRIGSAGTAVKLLTTGCRDEAVNFAEMLEKANAARKSLEAEIFAQAVEMITPEALDSQNSLILYKNDWHQGVLGIVASRLCDRFHRPVILLTDCSQEEAADSLHHVKGSGRSVEGIDIHETVTGCQELLYRFGGHAGAVGLTLKAVDIDEFRSRFEAVLSDRNVKNLLTPTLEIDFEVTLNDLCDQTFFTAYKTLSPFGYGNPEPVFCLTSQKLLNPRVVGSSHLKFSLIEESLVLNGIGFGLGNHLELSQNCPVDLAFTLRLNTYRGRENWEINLIDLQPSLHHSR